MRVNRADNLVSFLTIIKKIKEENTLIREKASAYNGKEIIEPDYIFRGHSCAEKYKLWPGIFRKNDDKKSLGYSSELYLQNELKILNDFMCEASGYIKGIDVSDYTAYLEIAQHYGLPTRLLDFTYNPLVALYFACQSNDNENGVVWYLDERGYKEKYYPDYSGQNPIVYSKKKVNEIINLEIFGNVKNEKDVVINEYPWIYKPMYREARMSMQSSVFVLWAKNQKPLDGMINNSINDEGEEEKILGRIDIPAGVKGDILKDLDSFCGINKMFIYPGLDGVGKYLNDKYKYPLNPLNWLYHCDKSTGEKQNGNV